MSADDYIRLDTAPFYRNASGNARRGYLLWGDGVDVINRGASRTEIRARGRNATGFVDNNALGGDPLLEYYFIDVGQGDAVLIRTPDLRHILIDGGSRRSVQDTGKNAADFVDWKFYHDYEMDRIELDVMMASHNDEDHYGGLWDLLNTQQEDELNCGSVSVEAFYHAGLAWWEGAGGNRTLGPTTTVGDDTFFTRLMGDRAQVQQATGNGPGPKLQGYWRDFMTTVVSARRRNGTPTRIGRLSHVSGYVPGFEDNTDTSPALAVLAPVEFDVNGDSAIRRFSGGNSKNTNGNSLLIRVDYGRTRTLLTGDLNTVSMRALLDDYAGERVEFLCDVAKGCHHGSDDVSYEFLQAMYPAVTIISSGDNEGHDHPRPSVVAASATTGYLQIENDQLISPLVYSTELARSLDLGYPRRFEELDSDDQIVHSVSGAALRRSRMHISKSRKAVKQCKGAMVVGDLIYGLVNVRTDGNRILCATMDERGGRWRVETLQSRF
ncbi:MAG: ComEC/Rec2 family competence protein [Planctomycetota bacterium]|jgi:beta-lactamase superfamily II metal-dependent hydrolase